MSISVTTRDFAPFGKCVVISNGDIEAVVTVDIGPRIIALSALGGKSILHADTSLSLISDDPRIKAAYGKDCYHFYGGHRLWWTPERIPETYAPEDDPIEWRQTDCGAVFTKLHPTKMEYSIEISMPDSGAHIDLFQKVKNVSGGEVTLAPWSITQCRAGGIAVAPQNTRQCAPLPNRTIVHWPYNDMQDKRFVPAARYITLTQDAAAAGPFKFGMNNETGWAGYLIDGQLLRKSFAKAVVGGCYEDYGCNFESYTDANALEIEALGNCVTLADGELTELNESLDVIPFEGAVPDVSTDAFADFIDKIVG